MAITYNPFAGEAPTVDPDDARGPWTFELPDTNVNGYAVTIKIWPAGLTPITVTALGAGAVVEDPTVPGNAATSVTFSAVGVGAAMWVYNLGLNTWGIYGSAIVRQAGRGQMQAGQQLISDITGAWTPIVFDSTTQPAHGMTMTPATGEFIFLWPGWWELRLQTNLGFTETQASRFTEVRAFNITEQLASDQIRIPVGRNQDGFLVNIGMRFLVDTADVGDTYVMGIGNGDTLANVTMYSNSLSFNNQTLRTD